MKNESRETFLHSEGPVDTETGASSSHHSDVCIRGQTSNRYEGQTVNSDLFLSGPGDSRHLSNAREVQGSSAVENSQSSIVSKCRSDRRTSSLFEEGGSSSSTTKLGSSGEASSQEGRPKCPSFLEPDPPVAAGINSVGSTCGWSAAGGLSSQSSPSSSRNSQRDTSNIVNTLLANPPSTAVISAPSYSGTTDIMDSIFVPSLTVDSADDACGSTPDNISGPWSDWLQDIRQQSLGDEPDPISLHQDDSVSDNADNSLGLKAVCDSKSSAGTCDSLTNRGAHGSRTSTSASSDDSDVEVVMVEPRYV